MILSMSTDGKRIAMSEGARDRNSGLVRVYQYSSEGEGKWGQIGDDVGRSGPDDGFGYSMSLSANGNRIVVGRPMRQSGSVMVFDLIEDNEGNQSWKEFGRPIKGLDGDEYKGKNAWSISLSADGEKLAIGSDFDNNEGVVRVFELKRDGEKWDDLGEFIPGGARMVSLSSTGNELAVATPLMGLVRMLKYEQGEWVETGRMKDGEGGEMDLRSHTISLSGDGESLTVGSPRLMDENGLVRVFHGS
uniref:Anaphase-promoting complex subunit 4 WD40 domain-containing protein n=1 Tax=Trieres chinensis TaxID=1514140 RepID=A0A7S1Z6A2_TRICV